MTPDEVLAELQEKNEDALLLEPREVYDTALVDVTDEPDDQWHREKKAWVAVYDPLRCIKAIMEWQECPQEEAEEWFGFNTAGAWVGPGTPTFRLDPPAPFVLTDSEQITSMPPFPFPHLGFYPGAVDDADATYERLDSLFCTKGSPDDTMNGAALTPTQLVEALQGLLDKHGPLKLAIEDEGAFRLYVGVWKDRT